MDGRVMLRRFVVAAALLALSPGNALAAASFRSPVRRSLPVLSAAALPGPQTFSALPIGAVQPPVPSVEVTAAPRTWGLQLKEQANPESWMAPFQTVTQRFQEGTVLYGVGAPYSAGASYLYVWDELVKFIGRFESLEASIAGVHGDLERSRRRQFYEDERASPQVRGMVNILFKVATWRIQHGLPNGNLDFMYIDRVLAGLDDLPGADLRPVFDEAIGHVRSANGYAHLRITPPMFEMLATLYKDGVPTSGEFLQRFGDRFEPVDRAANRGRTIGAGHFLDGVDLLPPPFQ